jgi:hypothetical protein
MDSFTPSEKKVLFVPIVYNSYQAVFLSFF